jgi:hypothetical protein
MPGDNRRPLSIIAAGMLSGRCRMPLALSADFLSRFSTLSAFITFNKPNTMNVPCAARAQSCAGRMARAGNR